MKKTDFYKKVIAAGTVDTKTNRYVASRETFENYKNGTITAWVIRTYPIKDIKEAPANINEWPPVIFFR